MAELMRIGDITKKAGVTPRTLRYYISLGLIPEGEREGHGQFYFNEETLYRLIKIDQLKKLGLSLDEIGEVIDLYFTDPSGVEPKKKVIAILRQHLAEAQQKIGALQQFCEDIQYNIDRFERWFDEKSQA